MTQVKERPILFSGPMVQALLNGNKTQTRRIVKPQPEIDANGNLIWPNSKGERWNYGQSNGQPHWESLLKKCPYGQPGDRLWVRETWGIPTCRPGVAYRADASAEDAKSVEMAAGWKPSIHMYRDDSRILLEIVSVRVERLQAISRADAVAEGVEEHGSTNWWKDYTCDDSVVDTPEVSYETLWESINGPESWEANPWVWVVEFKRITP